MSVTVRVVEATPSQVWSVLADGWLYPAWVVGASSMRQVADDWPAVGSTIDHSVGTWPVLIDDVTEVVRSEPESHLELLAKASPAGEAVVVLRLEVEDRAGGAATRVTMEEHVTAGPGRLIPGPLVQWAMDRRNAESLKRLSLIAERRR